MFRLIARCGLLTAGCVRDITSALWWRPASVDTEHGAKLSTNPASMGLSGQNDLLINGRTSLVREALVRRNADDEPTRATCADPGGRSLRLGLSPYGTGA